MLKSLGFNNVKLVDDGQKAIDAAFANRFKIILMDCMMPHVSGFLKNCEGCNGKGLEATEVIKRDMPKEKQPVIIALTADAFSENEQRCLAVGMQKVLTKP
jgi:CheY-like chemotaxis protein